MSAASAQVEVPDIGDFTDVPVIEILVSVGDTVAEEDPLVTLESDKATMDVPAPHAGTVKEIAVSVGDTVSQGSALMVIDSASEDGDSASRDEDDETDAAEDDRAAPEPEASAQDEPSGGDDDERAPEADEGTTPESGANGGGPIYASPSARRLARELSVDLEGVTGSGRKGRITRDDVQHAADGDGSEAGGSGETGGGDAPAKSPAPTTPGTGLELRPWPKVDFERYGPVERIARSRIQKISAPNLARNWVMIPHVTHNDEADITDLEAWRKRLNDEHAREGVKFTIVAFLVKAAVAALKAFPDFNASLDGDDLVRRLYWNIGFAADTPGGLVVPVIKEADRKGLKEIAADLTELSGKARDGKLRPGDMSGATFTISSLGGIGGTSFTPIINAPEVAILGVTRSATKPVWDGSEFVPRLMVPLSLSYDHRALDGAAAARFTAYLAGVLTDMRRTLL